MRQSLATAPAAGGVHFPDKFADEKWKRPIRKIQRVGRSQAAWNCFEYYKNRYTAARPVRDMTMVYGRARYTMRP